MNLSDELDIARLSNSMGLESWVCYASENLLALIQKPIPQNIICSTECPTWYPLDLYVAQCEMLKIDQRLTQ